MRTQLALLLVLLVHLSGRSQKITTVDICVYGGTSAGVIAAYTASKSGKTVLLIEQGKHLGGLSSGGLGYTDIGNKYAVTGLARDFYRRIGEHYGKLEQWIFEPRVAEETFTYYITQKKVNVLYDYQIISTEKEKGIIREILIENSTSSTSSSNRIIRAKMFIDCSYEGDLMAKANVSYTVGREANAQYNETYNGVQLRDKHQFLDGIDPYKIPGKPESGLLWGISNEALPLQGLGDKKVQAYNFRICLTRDPQNKIAITQPENYDSSRYELLIRVLQKEPNRPFNLILKPDLMPNQKTDINNNGPFSTDMIGMNYDYPEASYAKRKEITKKHEEYVKGLLYFIGHSQRMPQHLREEMLQWGYPKDEYADNGNWSPQMYVREARRMVGAYVMTQANCEGKETITDGVGMAAYTMDSHNIQRLVVNGMVKNEGDVQMGGFPPYPISYRSLIPKIEECKNLLVPVCLSATHIAYGSIRMEPVFMVLGQSSAVAASMAIDSKKSVQEIDVRALQTKLKIDPLANGSVSEIMIDNEDKESIKVTGSWKTHKNARGCYGLSLLSVEPGAGEQSVRFIPNVEKEGSYDVYLYVPKLEKASTKIGTLVYANSKAKSDLVSVSNLKVEGQAAGEWISLGKHFFAKGRENYIEVNTQQADGTVIADAVLLLPSKN